MVKTRARPETNVPPLDIEAIGPTIGAEIPEIMVLDNHQDNPVLSTDVWHSDTTFRARPTLYSILRCLQMPDHGGDTLWADMAATGVRFKSKPLSV